MTVCPARLILLLPCLLLALACESGKPEYDPRAPGSSTALLIDYQSLPDHRHAETLDRLQRGFLAMQSPGDHLILANEPNNTEAASPLTLSLPDSPLATTRLLRSLRERLDEGRPEAWQDRNEALLLKATAQLYALAPPRCLYLAVDPDLASIPTPPDLSQGDEQRTRPFTAFLLTPSAGDPDRVSVWVRHLHALGAHRIKRHSLGAELPACR
jgi:hypothetical protein